MQPRVERAPHPWRWRPPSARWGRKCNDAPHPLDPWGRYTRRADARAQVTMSLPGGQGLRPWPMPSLHYRHRPSAAVAGGLRVKRFDGSGRARQKSPLHRLAARRAGPSGLVPYRRFKATPSPNRASMRSGASRGNCVQRRSQRGRLLWVLGRDGPFGPRALLVPRARAGIKIPRSQDPKEISTSVKGVGSWDLGIFARRDASPGVPLDARPLPSGHGRPRALAASEALLADAAWVASRPGALSAG